MSNWPAVEAALDEFATAGSVSPGVFAALADRVRTAIEAPDAAKVEEAAQRLEELFRQLIAVAPRSVREASRGKGEPDILAGYALGKIAFAHLLAARIADTRADRRFIEHLSDRRYLPLVTALYNEALAVSALREKVGERLETVSRKLAVLRSLGIVISKKHGNVVVNMLSPAARALVDQLGLVPSEEVLPLITMPDIKQTIENKRAGLQSHMKEVAHFTARSKVVPIRRHLRKAA